MPIAPLRAARSLLYGFQSYLGLNRLPSRSKVTFTASPTPGIISRGPNSSLGDSVFLPSIAVMTSPRARAPRSFPPRRTDAGLGGRASGDDIYDQYAGHAEPLGDLLFGDLNSQSRPDHFPVTNQLGHDAINRVRRDRKADPRRRSGRAVDSGIHADQSAGAVEQRSSRVARIDRGVGLNDALNRPPRHGLDLPTQRADYSRGQRLVETERITDGKNALADLQVFDVPNGIALSRFAGASMRKTARSLSGAAPTRRAFQAD